jgi:hypothetical protein
MRKNLYNYRVKRNYSIAVTNNLQLATATDVIMVRKTVIRLAEIITGKAQPEKPE